MIQPRDFYNLAQDLFSNYAWSEVLGRTLVGRAYYSALLEAKARIEATRSALLASVEPESIHSRVREALKLMGYGNVAGKLYELGRRRATADYFPNETVAKPYVKEALALCLNLLQLLQRIGS